VPIIYRDVDDDEWDRLANLGGGNSWQGFRVARSQLDCSIGQEFGQDWDDGRVERTIPSSVALALDTI